MSKAKCIMVQGTMSGAGKSLLCAALCRIFAQDGYRVAPFKSQNMALNSFVTRNGAEMGRAQVVQAQAAGVEPDVRMNPILLKPSSDVGSQVIVNGKARGQMSAAAYFQDEAQPYPGHSGSLQQPCRRERHYRDRRRGQPGGDQPESRRYREHGPCKAGGCAGAAGGRYRPGRRIRAAVRHCGAAGSRRACPHQGAHHQQVPGRCGDPAARPCHAGRKNAAARAGRSAVPAGGDRGRGLSLRPAG